MAYEVFDIVQGLPPHPDELKLNPWAETRWAEPSEKAGAAASVVPEYPPDE